MDRTQEQQIDLTKEEIIEMLKDLEPGTMLTLEMPDRPGENYDDLKEGGE